MITRKYITKDIENFCNIINRRDRDEELSVRRRRARFHANKKKFDFSQKVLKHIYNNILRLKKNSPWKGEE